MLFEQRLAQLYGLRFTLTEIAGRRFFVRRGGGRRATLHHHARRAGEPRQFLHQYPQEHARRDLSFHPQEHRPFQKETGVQSRLLSEQGRHVHGVFEDPCTRAAHAGTQIRRPGQKDSQQYL